MFEEPTFTEEEERTLYTERTKVVKESPLPFICVALFALGCLMITCASDGIEYVEDFEEEWADELDWTCSYCGNTNGGENSSCCACGGSK